MSEKNDFLDFLTDSQTDGTDPFQPNPLPNVSNSTQAMENSLSQKETSTMEMRPIKEQKVVPVQPNVQPDCQLSPCGEAQDKRTQQKATTESNFFYPESTAPAVSVPIRATAVVDETPKAAAAVVSDPFTALAEQAKQEEAERIVSVLQMKNPVFKYGTHKDEITNGNETFDSLRDSKKDDFTEFQEGTVSWTIEYGKETRYISKTSENIHEAKKNIEESKEFREHLLKAKREADRSPTCYVKPKITGKKKGEMQLPSYKGYCNTLEEAEKSTKTLIMLPSKDGSIYRLEKTPIGNFIAPAKDLSEYQDISSGFYMRLPKIPLSLLFQSITFFQSIWLLYATEALVMIRYNKITGKYRIEVPEQTATSASVESNLVADNLDSESVHVLDIHSHHTMAAKFSEVDNRDEQPTGLYAVVGRLNDPVPDISLRASCGGTFFPVSLSEVFDTSCSYPPEWDSRVHKHEEQKKTSPVILTRGWRRHNGI